jgi:hypothetical protein
MGGLLTTLRGRSLVHLGIQNFSLAAFMAAQSDGFYYDFIKTDRLFQENIGPTPADDVGELIGLALDQRQWNGQTLAQVLATQSELVTNGTFDTDLTGWTDAGGDGSASVDAGALKIIEGATANEERRQVLTVTVGAVYKVSCSLGGTAPIIFIGSTSGGAELGNIQSSGTRYITATTTTLSLRCRTGNALGSGLFATFDNVSVKLIPSIPAIQATGSLKPALQTTGAKFDGSDDNLLTSYTSAVGANFIAALISVPASLPGTQTIVGSNDGVPNRCRLSVNPNGNLCAAVGTQLENTIFTTSNLRGTEVVVCLSFDGTTVRLFDNPAAVAYQAAQSGVPTTTIPYRLGSLNSNGSSTQQFGGSIKKIVAGREFISIDRYRQIRDALLAT